MLSLTTLSALFSWLERQTESTTVRGLDELQHRLQRLDHDGFVVRGVHKDGDFFVVQFAPGQPRHAEALRRQPPVEMEAKVA